MSIRGLLAVFVWAILLPGCGYTARARLPEDLSTVAVPIFRNQTFYRDIDLELTQALRKEILAKTHLRVADQNNARLVLEGDVTDFILYRLREDVTDRVIEFQVRLKVDAELRDARTNQVLASVKDLTRQAEFLVSKGEAIEKARDEAVREMAREIVSQVINRW
ncbi:MAG: hypothetical protein HYU36_18160 [Planctomycetes bacterium]|nr:hypothetical protein [Planctomycetota bacterium]